jgi:hypothetical protein
VRLALDEDEPKRKISFIKIAAWKFALCAVQHTCLDPPPEPKLLETKREKDG